MVPFTDLEQLLITGAPLTLLGVWAHPDDEAYLSAGLMGRIADAGGRVVTVHATVGELGTDDPDRWPPERLGHLRRRELAASLAAVGVTDSRILGLPDGHLDQLDGRRTVARLVETITELGPDLIVTFGSDGMTGHGDHRTISRWATEAWLRTDRRADLLFATTTAGFVERHRDLYAEHELVMAPGLPLATPAHDLAVDLELTELELDRKRVALAAHASQTARLAEQIGEDRFRRWFDHESFRRPTALERRIVRPDRRAAA